MKKVMLSLVIGSSIAFFSSCGNEEQKKEETKAVAEKKVEETKKCMYSVDASSVKVEWTSFKHTAKTPVGGTFEMLELGHTTEAETAVETFKEATLSINARTVDSKNDVRDQKIKDSFFGTMEKTDFLTGKIKSLDGIENGNGKAVISITMNGIEKDQDFSWSTDNETVEFSTELSVENWSAKPSLDSLNKVCEDLHKGDDGLSVLWPTVEVKITANLKKDCQ